MMEEMNTATDLGQIARKQFNGNGRENKSSVIVIIVESALFMQNYFLSFFPIKFFGDLNTTQWVLC